MKISFQQAKEDDWEEVQNLETSCKNKYFFALTCKEDIIRYLKNSKVFLIKDNKKKIGTISYEVKSKGHAYINGFTVHPSVRNKGIGKKAMEYIINNVKGFSKITLVTHPKNLPALIIYLKAGFYIYGYKNNYYKDGEPRLLMVKELKKE
ncbi:MAG: N-acetyltransferase [Candidatus Nanoarchaeia archaeon]|nr:N-acetyltransferase [Candidatus Nanoarchaeia archaeon]